MFRFIARYELPLRGKKDHGRITMEEPDENDGVLRGLIRLMMHAGDTKMQLLVEAQANASYLSPQSQNLLLNCYAKVVIAEIVQGINNAGVNKLYPIKLIK